MTHIPETSQRTHTTMKNDITPRTDSDYILRENDLSESAIPARPYEPGHSQTDTMKHSTHAWGRSVLSLSWEGISDHDISSYVIDPRLQSLSNETRERERGDYINHLFLHLFAKLPRYLVNLISFLANHSICDTLQSRATMSAERATILYFYRIIMARLNYLYIDLNVHRYIARYI